MLGTKGWKIDARMLFVQTKFEIISSNFQINFYYLNSFAVLSLKLHFVASDYYFFNFEVSNIANLANLASLG